MSAVRYRGDAGRSWRRAYRATQNEIRLAKCTAGETHGEVVRPCGSCGEMVYWHVSEEGHVTLRDPGGDHFRKCAPRASKPSYPPIAKRRRKQHHLTRSEEARLFGELLDHVVPGHYSETARAFHRVSGKSVPQCKRYIAKMRKLGLLDEGLNVIARPRYRHTLTLCDPIEAPETASSSVSLTALSREAIPTRDASQAPRESCGATAGTETRRGGGEPYGEADSRRWVSVPVVAGQLIACPAEPVPEGYVRLLGGSVVQIPPRHEEDGLPLLARLRELTRGATMTKEQHPRSVAAENRLDGVGS